MQVPFLNLAAQHAAIQDEVSAAVLEILASGHYILGPRLAAFEEAMAEFTQTEFGIGVNSGSDALTLSLRALGIGPGDEVITTPFTYIAPAEAIHQMGARIVFADIDPETFNLDPASVAPRITRHTKALIPVHLFGQPAPMRELLELARLAELEVVEDCAQAIGATYRDQPVGSLGRVGCFSFYPTKNLGADGDGGMIVTRDAELAQRLRMLRVHGSAQRYTHSLHGYNSRLDEVQAAILSVKLKHLPAWNARRQAIAQRYREGLSDLPLQLPVTAPDATHVYHVFAVLCEERDRLHAYLAEHGIPTIIYYPRPLHLQPVYAELGGQPGDLPVAEEVSRKILSLPMYPELTDAQVDYVIQTLRAFDFQA